MVTSLGSAGRVGWWALELPFLTSGLLASAWGKHLEETWLPEANRALGCPYPVNESRTGNDHD